MRLRTYVGVALVLVGCSSAATLPSGGPYGGAAGDAGVSVGGQVDAGSGIVFDPGGGASSSSGGIIIIGSSSGTGATVTSGSSIVTTSASSATMGATSSSGSTNAPTWTDLYNTYLSDATTTIGDCDGSCHYHTECSSASACYSWIGTGKYGALSNGGGLFTWDQGYMPKDGPTSDATAEAAFAAWIAAGSPDN